MKKPIGRTRPKQALSWICIVVSIIAGLGVAWMAVGMRTPPPITSAPPAQSTSP